MDPPPRIKLLLANRGLQMAAILALVGFALIGGGGYVYSTPDTRTVTETTNQQQFSTALETSAVVGPNSTLYEEGETLNNMPVYLFRATPELTLSIQTSVPDDQPIQVDHRLFLVYQATRDGQPFFAEERQLIDASHEVESGSASDSVTLNMTDVQQKIVRIQEEIAGAGTLATQLRLEVDYASDQYEGQFRTTSTLQITENAYLLSGQLDSSDSRSQTNARVVREPPDVRTAAILGVIGVLLIVAGGVVFRSRQGIDIEEVLTERDHVRYEEWISNGEFPTAADNKYTAIQSLEDLVDVAIDTDKRVIYDADFDSYAVVDGNVVYYFAVDPETVDPWLDT